MPTIEARLPNTKKPKQEMPTEADYLAHEKRMNPKPKAEERVEAEQPAVAVENQYANLEPGEARKKRNFVESASMAVEGASEKEVLNKASELLDQKGIMADMARASTFEKGAAEAMVKLRAAFWESVGQPFPTVFESKVKALLRVKDRLQRYEAKLAEEDDEYGQLREVVEGMRKKVNELLQG